MQTAIIAGASIDIGYALSIELAKRNIRVVAIARQQLALQKLQEQHPDQMQASECIK